MDRHLLRPDDLGVPGTQFVFLCSFLAQTDIPYTDFVSLSLALRITVKTWIMCYAFSESEKLSLSSAKCLLKAHLFLDKVSPMPSPPGPPVLISVSLAQTFTPACPAAP